MKKFVSVGMAMLLALSSCAGLQTMDPQQLAATINQVEQTVVIGTLIAKSKIKPEVRAKITSVSVDMRKVLSTDGVIQPTSVGMLISWLADQLAKEGVKDEDIILIRATGPLADSVLGPIKLGVDGIGDEKTRMIALAVLRGLETGLK